LAFFDLANYLKFNHNFIHYKDNLFSTILAFIQRYKGINI